MRDDESILEGRGAQVVDGHATQLGRSDSSLAKIEGMSRYGEDARGHTRYSSLRESTVLALGVCYYLRSVHQNAFQ